MNNNYRERSDSRKLVQAIKDNPGALRIVTEDGITIRLRHDYKLNHDIALVVQDFFRRTGKDFSNKSANV